MILSPPLQTKGAIVKKSGKGQLVWRLEEGRAGCGISVRGHLGASMGIPQGGHPSVQGAPI